MKLRSGFDSSLSGEMSSSPPSPKRIRLDGEVKWEELPDHVWDKILRYLSMKDRIHGSLVSKRWRRLMCYTDGSGCLRVTNLPFKADLLATTPRGDGIVTHRGITAALQCLLPQPQIGSKLKKLSFWSCTRHWEMVASHFDLIAQHCPNLITLGLLSMCCAEPNDCKWEALRRLTHLSTLGFENFSDPTETHENFQVTQRISSLITMWRLSLTTLALVNFKYLPHIAAPNLTFLLRSCKNVDDFQWAQICQTSPNLTNLELKKVTLGGGEMESIAQSCPRLHCLTVEKVENLGKFTWFRHLSQLKFLSVSPGLVDSDVADLPSNWSIKILEMFDSQLTDAGLAQLSLKCPQLKRLNLHNNSITDAGIYQIAAKWQCLMILKAFSAKITDVSMVRLGLRRKLRQLDIENCSGISSVAGFSLLVAKRRQFGISTPLRIKLGRNHTIFTTETIDQLKEQLKTVGVTLIQ